MDTKRERGNNWETGIDSYTALVLSIKWITNKNMYCLHRERVSVHSGDLRGGSPRGRGRVYAHAWGIHSALQKKLTKHGKATRIQ